MRRLVCFALCWFTLIGAGSAWAKAGLVEGTVSPTEWAPEVEVCLAGTETCTAPGADGSYVLFAPEGRWTIEFAPSYRSRLLTQYYDGKTSIWEADPVTVEAEVPVKAIDGDLVEGGAIRGTVTSVVGGGPLGEVEACAVSTGGATVKVCDATDVNGEYELHSLPPALYRVGFWGTGASAEYEPAFRPGAPVGVEAGITSGEIDETLAKGAQIRGTVTDAIGGGPLAGVPVCLFEVAAPVPERCAASDGFGSYAFVGLPTGQYQVGFSLESTETGGQRIGGADGFVSQFYSGAGTRAEAITISLLAGQGAWGVDAALLAAPAPPALGAPVAVADPAIPAIPAVVEPAFAKQPTCTHHRHKVRVKGRARCVNKRHHHVHRKRRHHHRHRSKKLNR